MFPSPRGDKLQSLRMGQETGTTSFRPLAGINCNGVSLTLMHYDRSFRPLAGINCNQAQGTLKKVIENRFRPLAGINCNMLR